jgi:hypothetical protein
MGTVGNGQGMKKKKYKPIPGGYVTMPWNMLNSKAYITLPPTSRAMLPYFLGKVRIPCTETQHYYAEFSFTYSEATKYGCARRSFYRVIEGLMGYGFIDPVLKGGMIGGRETGSIFRLSKRWEKYGTAVFEKVTWAQFGESQIRSQVQKWHRTVAKNEPGENKKVKQVCQK